jgi:hypothetical protein
MVGLVAEVRSKSSKGATPSSAKARCSTHSAGKPVFPDQVEKWSSTQSTKRVRTGLSVRKA